MTPPDDDIRTAFHEAGHAVIALALGRIVQRVSILPNGSRLGHCELSKGSFKPSKDVLETEILILLGGLAAEARLSQKFELSGASQDLRQVRRLTQMRASGPRQIERLESRMLSKSKHLMSDAGHWRAVELIAGELIRVRSISGRAARYLFDRAIAEIEDE